MLEEEKDAIEVFRELRLMADRWHEYWGVYTYHHPNLRPHQNLAAAISNFMFKEFERHPSLKALEDQEDVRYALGLAMMSKAIPLSGTHTESFVIDTMALMRIGKTNTRLPAMFTLFLYRRLNSSFKRLALVVFFFFSAIDAAILDRDLKQSFYWSPSLIFILLSLVSITSLLVAFTDLVDWVHSG